VISFVWSLSEPLPAGTGGSENYTVGQVRGIEPPRYRGTGRHDRSGDNRRPRRIYRCTVPGVGAPRQPRDVEGTRSRSSTKPRASTQQLSFQILHDPLPIRARYRALSVDGAKDRQLIATSRYSAALWAEFLDVDLANIHAVHPFAEPASASSRARTLRPVMCGSAMRGI
jgi:D-inositol-3-phosphate glycosyltransferase